MMFLLQHGCRVIAHDRRGRVRLAMARNGFQMAQASTTPARNAADASEGCKGTDWMSAGAIPACASACTTMLRALDPRV